MNRIMCYLLAGFDGCPFEIDDVWRISWPNTPQSSSSTQICPGGLGMLHIGVCNSMLFCGIWDSVSGTAL